jgi:hypothetical protein
MNSRSSITGGVASQGSLGAGNRLRATADAMGGEISLDCCSHLAAEPLLAGCLFYIQFMHNILGASHTEMMIEIS